MNVNDDEIRRKFILQNILTAVGISEIDKFYISYRIIYFTSSLVTHLMSLNKNESPKIMLQSHNKQHLYKRNYGEGKTLRSISMLCFNIQKHINKSL